MTSVEILPCSLPTLRNFFCGEGWGTVGVKVRKTGQNLGYLGVRVLMRDECPGLPLPLWPPDL